MKPLRHDASRPAAPAATDWEDDDAPFTTGAPEHDFAVRRVTLIVLLLAAIVLPCVYVAVMAYNDLRTREATARDVTMRTVRVAEEHALKVFDLTETLDARIVDLVQDLDDESVRKSEADIHDALNTIGGGYPQVAAVSIFGASGMLLANSLYYPAPHASIANRDDFIGIRDNKVIEHISRPMRGPMRSTTPSLVFNTGVARQHSDGSFAGMVSIALKSSYFNAFYRDLLGGESSPMSMALTRSDGAVLASYPPPPETGDEKLDEHEAPFVNASASSPRAGIIRVEHDGASEIVAYRQVGSYPVYVICAYRAPAIWRAWYEHLSVLFISMFAPSLALWCVIWLSLKRLRVEEQAWDRWQAEASMRRSIESAYRQSRKMEALGNLVGSVAHDFNNLLMIISSNIQIVRRRGAAHLDVELTAIERALKNGQSLTRQLLGVARKQPLRSETIDVPQWLGSSCRELLKTSLGSKSALVFDMPPGIWPIRVDIAELELAVINLSVNARDAMPTGGRFTIAAQNITFRHEDGFPLTGDFVQLSLADTGSGMAPEVLAHAFEPLFTTKPKGMGTGLGLPQVFAFCERSGGIATIDSALGEGTTVRLYLPRARITDEAPPAAPASREASSLETDPPREGLRILLVEDNGEVAAGTEALLSLLGHRVTYAANADDALALIDAPLDPEDESRPFDLVISDIHMPGTLNGIDLAEEIERRPGTLPVILVTGYAEELDRTRRVNARVLSKPFDIGLLDDMLHAIRQARDARKSGRIRA
ncbi:response regulator [Burkholderia gladioli pv. gladioli]|uniref:histidine kinase n=1 Tax=Burkholderia gladioli TaxID=28095 RepID=A0AAW3F252_BURGA|nr:hybrid sensor histidine kinase/response regulator [Burkholderia gladioli]AJW95346.1 response regulator [Burkholderia gladioli]ASD83499.1 hybrid sensor histidine kinase/response regulator [Burkholderia gladioli pv. gladioli]AWY50928.1 hybrid sensor histidine kinase/response regulator [Burkholderia gladioli pv. gladioli]KGC13851.1 response regulator [Burkholderia gladioli]MDJ1166922.1 response regulator [Burkholderia gladioli pv. gladioli]